jgi:hypothetical protein
MRLSTLAMALILSAFAQVSLASPAQCSCVDMSPSIACIDALTPSASYDKLKAARACAGGVSVACIDALTPAASYDKLKAAASCKGGVTVECIDALTAAAGYDKLKAAAACGGN